MHATEDFLISVYKFQKDKKGLFLFMLLFHTACIKSVYVKDGKSWQFLAISDFYTFYQHDVYWVMLTTHLYVYLHAFIDIWWKWWTGYICWVIHGL